MKLKHIQHQRLQSWEIKCFKCLKSCGLDQKKNMCDGQLQEALYSVSFKMRPFVFLKTLENINLKPNNIWNLILCIDHDQKRPLRCRNWMISHASTTDIHVNGLPQGRTKRRYCRMAIYVSCNKRNSFLNFGEPQWYNSEASRFTYDQYVVIELVCFCVSLDKQFFQVAGAGDWTTDLWITKSALYL